MFAVAVELRAFGRAPACCGQELAVHTQVVEALAGRPLGQLGVDALAVDDQRRHQADVLAAVIAHPLRSNRLGGLRQHGDGVAVFIDAGGAVLCAQFDEQQAQEVVHLGGGAHGGLAPAPREALLDGHGGRDAVDGVHLGSARRLHQRTGIGVERFEVAALALVEQDVERQRRFARAGNPRDDVELATRDVHAQALEVVLVGVDDLDAVVAGRGGGTGPALVTAGLDEGLQRGAIFGRVAAQVVGRGFLGHLQDLGGVGGFASDCRGGQRGHLQA